MALATQSLATPALFFQGRALELREKHRELARSSLLAFGLYLRKDFQAYHHTKIVTGELEEWAFGEELRLILTMGAQYGKSSWSSILLPAYILGRDPGARILLLSYGASLSGEFNRAVQKIMDSEAYLELFPKSALGANNVRQISDKPRRNSDVIDIPGHDGMFVNAGIGGGYTGKGFTHIILDDLIKSRDEADSPTYRDTVDSAYTDTIKTRRASDRTRILILNTRWHLDDLTGRRLKAARNNPLVDQWRVVNLPALLSDCEDIESERWKFPSGQKPGREVLWPEHFRHEDVLATKAENEFNFAAQYMGVPVARGGNIIKREWFEPYQSFLSSVPNSTNTALYYDLGASAEPNADRTVGTVVHTYRQGAEPDLRTILLWQQSGQWSAGDRERHMEQFCLQWNKIIPSIPIYLEDTFGLSVAVAPGIRNRLLSKGLNVKLDAVKIRKFVRAEPFLASCAARRVELYDGTAFEESGFKNPEDWINEFLNEVVMLREKQTPNGPEFTGGHDDRLDSPVGGFNVLTRGVRDKTISEKIRAHYR